jgi:CRISPR-associated protein (TIGR02584 family)
MKPNEYERRILLAVTGLSPQVVTETLYALAIKRDPAFVPTEIHLLTTREGAERAQLALLSEDPGWFHRLRADYELPPIAFDARYIHVLRGADGAPLDDIRTESDNLAAADSITEQVRALTADDASAVHVSIAGGRKTMGFYLGYALSLFGRPQDRLSHVLVSEPYESSWNFFYPTRHSRVIEVPGNKLADTADAKVTLAEIPFVSLRAELPRGLLAGRATFAETVDAAKRALAAAELSLDPRSRLVRMAGKVFRLPPAEFALLAVLAHRARTGKPPLSAPNKNFVDADWAREYLADLRAAVGAINVPDSVETALEADSQGSYADYFAQQLSRLKRSLRVELDMAAVTYRIDEGRRRPRAYRLLLAPQAIRFESLNPTAITHDE